MEVVRQSHSCSVLCLLSGLVGRKLLHPENTLKVHTPIAFNSQEPLLFSSPPSLLFPQLQQYGIKLLVLWLQALQENAGDACMELFASAVPHFPPQKTPMGLPLDSPSPSLSSLSLCERYGTYSSTSIGPSNSATPLISPGRSSSTFSISSRGREKPLLYTLLYITYIHTYMHTHTCTYYIHAYIHTVHRYMHIT